MLNPCQPIALYMQGASAAREGKMGQGVLRYSPNTILCAIDSEKPGADMADIAGSPRRCPIVATIREAREKGAEVLVLGIAPPGGLIPQAWYDAIDEAVASGMSIVNGLHDFLRPRYPNLPEGQWVWDVRAEPPGLQPGTGAAQSLSNVRVLTIGTDMAVGKMTASLEIVRVARERGVRAGFVATGQIGMVVSGQGVPLDAVRVDFASGAIEREVMRCADAELVVVEGQGALIHPGSTANLPLLRGSCPTHLILCHRAEQTHLARLPSIEIPPLAGYARLYENLASACGAFPRPRTVAVALNTAHLGDAEATKAAKEIEAEVGLPCADPVRHGAERLLEAVLA